MKNIFLLGLAIVLIASCESNVKQRYTQQSPEIDTYKQVIANYESKNWQALAGHYADSAKILNNKTEEYAKTVTEMIEANKKSAEIFSSWSFMDNESDYEMVIIDNGETWVNFWSVWEGTLKANNKTYQIPIHTTTRFVDGKIVKELGFWDESEVVIDMMQLQQQEEAAQEPTETTEAETE